MPAKLATWGVEWWLGRAPESWEDVGASYAAWKAARRAWYAEHWPDAEMLEVLRVERAERHAGFGRYVGRGWPAVNRSG